MASLHSSPNRIVWEYFFTLRRSAYAARTADREELCRQSAALTVIMAVTVVEVFLNLFFRVCVSESGRAEHQSQFLDDLARRISLDKKIKTWPKRILGRRLRLDGSPGKHFMELKTLRNCLIHFTSSHETVDLGNVQIHGLADTAAYDTLSADQAANAVAVAESIVEEIFKLSGVDDAQLVHAMHAWTGKMPPDSSLQSDAPPAARA